VMEMDATPNPAVVGVEAGTHRVLLSVWQYRAAKAGNKINSFRLIILDSFRRISKMAPSSLRGVGGRPKCGHQCGRGT
jgi:hypothetical protein